MRFGPSQLSCLGSSVVEHSLYIVECCGFESHLRQLIFLRKSDCRECAVLLCLVVCLTLLASFFMCVYTYIHVDTCICILYYVHVGEVSAEAH